VDGKVEDKSMRSLKVAGLVLGAFLVMTLPASAAVRFRGGIVIVPAYRAWGWYNPFFFGPYGWYGAYGPYGPYPAYHSNAGELKLKTNVKDADVYINDALAGKASQLKTMWLQPAAYDILVRAPGYAPFTERLFIVAGKTTEVTANLAAAPSS
jgi:hypothetical protein